MEKQVPFSVFVVFWGLLAFFSALQGLRAQRPLDSLQYLKPVEVRGTRAAKRSENPLTPMQAFSVEDFRRMNALRVGDAVKNFAGAQVKDYGGVGGMKTVSVRSLGASHTAVSYDGVLLSDAQNGQIDLGRLYLDQVKTMSLYNGQSSSIFQPARNFSSAALLQIETVSLADLDSIAPFSAGFDFGSFLFLSPSFAMRKRIGKNFGFSASARFDYVKGDYPFLFDRGGEPRYLRRENTDVKGGNAELNFFALLSDKHRIDLKLFYYGSERGLPGAVIYYYKASAQRLEDQDFFGVMKHAWQIAPGWSQKNVLKYNFRYNRFRDPESLASQAVDERYRQNEVYASSSTLYQPPVKGLEIGGAFDAAFNSLASNVRGFPFPDRTSIWFNVAVKYKHRYGEAMLSGLTSAFFDRVRSGNSPGEKARFSPFASVAVFPLGKRIWSLRVFYKDIFRMPTFNDLYYSRVGNTGLLPEKARQIDAGSSFSLSLPGRIWMLEASVDFYRNWVEDKIVAYPTTNLFVWSMMNVDRVGITGVDASLKTGSAFGKTGLLSRFRFDLQVSYTWQEALDRTDPGNGTYGHRIAYTPEHSGSAVVSLGFPYGELSYRLMFCGSRYALNENIPENLLEPYAEHGLGLNFRFEVRGTGMEAGVEWLNFTGEAYQVVLNYPMPLAHYRVHLRCRF